MKRLILMAAMACVLGAHAKKDDGVPEHYSKIPFPEFKYMPPYPKDYRVELDKGVIAYLVPDSTLSLIQMAVFCGHPNFPKKPEDVASLNLYSSMLKSG